MGVIHEELEFIGNQEATLTLDECENPGMRAPYRNIALDVDHFDQYTPEELEQLGIWLIQSADLFKKKYDKDGKPK